MNKRRVAIAGLAVALAVSTSLPANSEPVGGQTAKKSGRFTQLDVAKLGKIVNAPNGLKPDKVVDALVELDTASVISQQSAGSVSADAAQRRVRASQAAAEPRLEAAGATPYGRVSTVLNAIQVKVAVKDLTAISKVRGVKSVEVSRIMKPENTASNRATGADKTWETYKHTGKGLVIGVIDTGIDYTHADFGGEGTTEAYEANDGTVVEPGSFPTAKVTGGYDFVGDDFGSDTEGSDIPKPDDDPLDCEGHGTHVAGTAAGDGVNADGTTYTGAYNRAALDQDFLVQPGSAPDATLKAYRVFGCDGGSPSSIIIAAIDRAVDDGVDVVNMSLGSDFGTNTGLERTVIQNATEAGSLIVASAGNAGGSAYIVGGPASINETLAVAAVDRELAKFPGVDITGAVTTSGLVANSLEVTTPITGELVDLGLGCDAAAYAAASGKIALTTRGTCDRVDRVKFGQEAGANAVIMINTTSDLPPLEGELAGVTIPFVGVSGDDSEALLAANGETVTLTGNAGVTNPGYKRVAEFSSNGPRRGDSAQKPDVAAPGVAIPSAAVGTGTGAVRASGTSMSAPHTAGVAALVWQAHRSWTPMQIKSLLMSTASPGGVTGFDSRRVGTGLVQPLRASEAKTYAWTPNHLNSLHFGMNELAGGWTETREFKITNKTIKTVTYDLSLDLSTSARGASFSISPKSVKLKPGDTKDVRVKLHLSRADTSKLPGVSANQGGELSSIHGFVLARPRSDRRGVLPLRVSMLFVPVPLSNVEASASVSRNPDGTYSPITVENTGIHSGTVDTYAWLIADTAGDVLDRDTPDLTNIGVQSLAPTEVGLDPDDRLLIFAASTSLGTSTQAAKEIDIVLDTNNDDTPDYLVVSVDTGLVLTGSPDGTVTSFAVDLSNGEIVDAWDADAAANGSTVLLPVSAKALGLSQTSGPVTVIAGSSAVVEDASPIGDETGSATFDAFTPAVSHGDYFALKPGVKRDIPVEVDPSRFGAQTHAGWLVVTPDDKAGLREVDRVKLIVDQTPVGADKTVKAGRR